MPNKQLYIDNEAVATLGLLQDGLLFPVTKLMNKEETKEVCKTKSYKGSSYPVPFLLAPSGKKNEKVLKSLKKGDKVDFITCGIKSGQMTVDEVFKIDKDERIKTIYATNNPEHPGVQNTYKRLGNYAVCGDFTVDFDAAKQHKAQIQDAIKNTDAKSVSAIMLAGKPFHRAHERIIRTSLVNNDLMVIFVLKPYTKDALSYETRYKTIEYFCNNYLPKDKFVLVPLENTYIFGGINELIFNAIVAKNYGCTSLVVGKSSVGLGAFYEKKGLNTILNTLEGINIKMEIMSKFVYCNKCSTLVSTNACPHGFHHHVNYHSESIMELLELGIIPPTLLMRKEISSIILTELFPQREEKLKKIYQSIAPSSGLLDDDENINFYEGLMDLYHTSSLT
jgi:sulfate adenylyltransferase